MLKRFYVFFLWLLCVSGSPTQEKTRLLDYRIVGSASCKTMPCWGKAMERTEVQRLFLQLMESPRTTAEVDSSLRGSGVTRDDLEKLRLIRREEDRYLMNFSVFSAADTRKIREVSSRYAQSLAAEITTRRQDIEAALKSYSAPGVDPKAVAFILLGCISLDWDGLDITAHKGYRKIADRRPDGQYVPWAEERSEINQLQNVYWGSHSAGNSGMQIMSFGDHFSLPRISFPDLFDRPADLRSMETVPDVLKSEGKFGKAGRQLGRIMVTLRDRERTLKELAVAAQIKSDEAEAWMKLLVRLEWANARGDNYTARIPIFTKRDVTMIRQIHEIGRDIMSKWLEDNYAKLRVELSGTTPMRWGVSYDEGFTMIWHWVFGLANFELVKSGLFADPYDQGRRYKGFIPCVFDAGTL